MKNNKVTLKSKSNWLTHEAQIEKGEMLAFDGWVNAYKESTKWKSVQDYARESAKLSTTHTANTIAQYVGAVKMGVKRYGTVDGLLKAYDNKFTYRSIYDLRSFVRGNGERSAKGKKRFSAKRKAEQFMKQGLTKAQVLEIAKHMK